MVRAKGASAAGAITVLVVIGAAVVARKGTPTGAIEPSLTFARDHATVTAFMRVRGGRARERQRDDHDDDETAADAIGLHIAPRDDGRARFLVARSPGGRFAADPALVALPSGDVLVTWLGFRANMRAHGEAYDMGVYAMRFDPRTGRTSSPVAITSDAPGSEFDRPWPALTSSGRVVVAYRFAHEGDGGIAVATSGDAATWSRSEIVRGFRFDGGLVTTCAADEAPHVYVAYFDHALGVVLRASHDDAAHFAVADERHLSLPEDNVADEPPSCFARGDDVVVAYGVGAGPIDSGASALLANVVIARSHDAGCTFTERVAVRATDRALLHPRVVADGAGFALAAYAPQRGQIAADVADVRIIRGTFDAAAPREVTLARAVRISPRRADGAWPGDYLGFAIDAARAEVAYIDATSGTPRLATVSVTLDR